MIKPKTKYSLCNDKTSRFLSRHLNTWSQTDALSVPVSAVRLASTFSYRHHNRYVDQYGAWYL
jgi:hypothetical protein